MASDTTVTGISPTGAPAPLVRLFGWAMLAMLAGFLINNVLVAGYDFPGLLGLFSGDSMGPALIQAAIYLVLIAFAVFYVVRNPGRGLRFEAQQIHKFNVYLISALFWGVLLVGVVDAAIAVMRVENVLGDGQLARDLGQANWVAPWIHMPLIALGFVIAMFSRTLGFHWLSVLIVLAELSIVISRFVFSYEQALMADLVRYWYAALFLFSSAYTLFEDGHVRVDVLYAGFGPTKRGFVNAWGSILLGMTTTWVILLIGFKGKQSIINSPVMNFEVTQAGTTGMYVKYQMAAFLGIFATTMLIQFVSYFFESVADWRDEPGRREVAAPSH